MSELDCCAINIYNNHRWWISFTISIPQHAQIQCKMKQSKWKNEDINSILLTVITINTSKVSWLKLWKGRIVIPQHDSPFLQQIQPKIWSSQHITGVFINTAKLHIHEIIQSPFLINHLQYSTTLIRLLRLLVEHLFQKSQHHNHHTATWLSKF